MKFFFNFLLKSKVNAHDLDIPDNNDDDDDDYDIHGLWKINHRFNIGRSER